MVKTNETTALTIEPGVTDRTNGHGHALVSTSQIPNAKQIAASGRVADERDLQHVEAAVQSK